MTVDPTGGPETATVHPDPLRFAATETRFGEGVVADLGAVLARHNVTAPLVVTDEGVRDAGILDRVLDALGGSATVHHATTEPSTSDFEGLPSASVDGVVAVGGGSCMDTAKVAAILLEHEGKAADYLGVDHVPGRVAPLVAVPTTSGTGSQATQTAVVTHEGVKRGISDEFIRPDVAVVDPELTYDLPRDVTATSGFDAFVHALESLTARDYRWVEPRPITYQGANPISRALSRRALALAHRGLERAVFDGGDREARRMMSLGSHLAGTAFSVAGLGAVHALASSVGGMVDRAHGECLAASIEAGLTYNLPVRASQYAAVARWLGASTAEDDRTAANALVDECTRLRDSIGLPGSFREVGLDSSDLEDLVENTLIQERRIKTNPRDVTADLGETLAPFL